MFELLALVYTVGIWQSPVLIGPFVILPIAILAAVAMLAIDSYVTR